ncbi:MAG: mannose-1-phosphate guanylyltransferase/mannose-6-phosphate isomerase [Rhizobiales bacterium]|nr:mannose-1-phosphate guanylyltransferase/mannose-6-phosphate isomerase [Hyphomicrobiales bacterium]
MTVRPIILAGGSGTRLWPLSRGQYPKQFIALGDNGSLFQQTLLRCRADDLYADPVIITNEAYRFLVAQQAADVNVPLAAILLEPSARNTAPALAVGALFCQDLGDDAPELQNLQELPVLHVMPSDHRIIADDAYQAAVRSAVQGARSGRLVTFGIKPTTAATGYGYIEAGSETAPGLRDVRRFVEKPDVKTATAFLDQGGFFWNSGMFVFSIGTFLEELRRFEPAMHDAAHIAVKKAERDRDFTRLDRTAFEAMKSISVDYAVFERTDRCSVVPAAISWSDLGTWQSIRTVLPPDAAGNSVMGRHVTLNARNNLVISDDKLVALNGVDNLAVIVSDDAVLVSSLDDSENVKRLVEQLKSNPDTAALTEEHRLTYRPWGGYSSILKRDRFQIKRLFVNPGARLSLQKHHHRTEHWVIVSGTAEVTVDGVVRILSENQSTYIPLGAVHRLANPGKIPLEVIEVQLGSYLGEDDIIRLDDEFGRK